MTKRQLLKQKISKARAAAAGADTAAYDAYAAYGAAAGADTAAYDAYAAARAAAADAAAADAADYDKHIALLDKAIERANVAAQNCIWKTQALKYKKENQDGT